MPVSPLALTAAALDALRGGALRAGSAQRLDSERVALSRARSRVLSESVASGQHGTALPAGLRLSPRDLAELAAAGLAEVRCARRPTVAVFTVGDALVPPGQALAAGQRHDAARPLLVALLQQDGVEAVAWPLLPGRAERIAAELREAAASFDVVIICGSVPAEAHAALLDEGGALLAGSSKDAAQLARIGSRQPQSLLLSLPDEVDAVMALWPQVGTALLAALQGEASAPAPLVAMTTPASSPASVDAREAAALCAAPGSPWQLIDVREPDEHASGIAAGASAVPLAQLLSDPAAAAAALDAPLLLICASGRRSADAQASLAAHGYRQVLNVEGGMAAWRAASLPLDGALDAAFAERYDRQLRLPGVGIEGQRRLQATRVVVVGAGGLGSPVALYLAAAGVGRLRLVDDDVVERSNLQRQVLHDESTIGQPKVDSAKARLAGLNPLVEVEAVQQRLDAANVDALLADADVVVDGSDNLATRYLLNAACLRLRRPLVLGAVERFRGQVMVFDARRGSGSPCYRCLFPEQPPDDAVPSCADAGVLGVLPGLVGLVQATEVLKLLLGLGEPLVGRMLEIDALPMRFREIALERDPRCPGCGDAG